MFVQRNQSQQHLVHDSTGMNNYNQKTNDVKATDLFPMLVIMDLWEELAGPKQPKVSWSRGACLSHSPSEQNNLSSANP